MNRYIKLSEVVKYSSKRIFSNRVSIDNFITTDNILPNKGGVLLATSLPPNGESMPSYNAKNILVGNIRPYLRKIWYADKSGGCSADVLVFEVSEDYNPKFVYYSMLRDEFFVHMMKGSKGTKMPRGDKNQILDFLIPNLELDEQQRIASVLSSFDSKIELNNRINAELEAMAKTIYDYWFVQFDFPDADGRPYKSSGGKMVWHEELKRDVPEGWGVGTLLNIAEYTNGLPCQKYRPINDESLRVIKIREMNEGFSSNSELVRPNIPEKAIVENGDVLFSWSASLEIKIWAGGKGALNQHIFKVTSDKFPKSFYYYQLLNYLQHFKMLAENRKTTMGHITQEHLQQSRIAIPTKELAQKLDEIIAPCFEMKMNNETENQKLSHLRDWLLPMLMNGQVRVG